MKTPETDELLGRILERDGYVDERNCPEQWVKLCRRLEEENGHLRSRNAEYCFRLADLRTELLTSAQRQTPKETESKKQKNSSHGQRKP